MNKITLLTLIALSSPLLAQQAPEDKPPTTMSEAFMLELDADKDGKVSKAEFLKPHESQFAHMDKNQDGYIDKAEIDAFAAEMREHMEKPGQQQQDK